MRTDMKSQFREYNGDDIFDAIRRKDFRAMVAILERNPCSANAVDHATGRTPLGLAAAKGMFRFCEAILKVDELSIGVDDNDGLDEVDNAYITGRDDIVMLIMDEVASRISPKGTVIKLDKARKPRPQ